MGAEKKKRDEEGVARPTLRMRTKRGKSRCAAPLRVLSYQGNLVVKAYRGLGGRKKRKEIGRAQQDETLWDADKEGKVTLRGSLACAPPPSHRGYEGIGWVGGGKKKKRDGGGAARRDAVGC